MFCRYHRKRSEIRLDKYSKSRFRVSALLRKKEKIIVGNKVAKLRDKKVISFALFDSDLSILAWVITDGKNPSNGRWKTDEISHTNIPEVIAIL